MSKHKTTLDDVLTSFKIMKLTLDEPVMKWARQLESSGRLQEILDDEGEIVPSDEAWRRINIHFEEQDMKKHHPEYADDIRLEAAKAETLLILIAEECQRERAQVN